MQRIKDAESGSKNVRHIELLSARGRGRSLGSIGRGRRHAGAQGQGLLAYAQQWRRVRDFAARDQWGESGRGFRNGVRGSSDFPRRPRIYPGIDPRINFAARVDLAAENR